MKSKSTRDVHVEEDKTNVIQWHGKAEKARGFLFWLEKLEKLERFGQLCNDDQRQCPEKLVCKIVRFHGCRWRKAFHCLCMDTLKTWRYHISLNALQTQRYQLRRRMLLHFIPHRVFKHVRMDWLFAQRTLHHQLYVSLTLDAQELWALERQLKLSPDMLTHIPTVVSSMKFIQQVQDSSLQSPSNPSALRNL